MAGITKRFDTVIQAAVNYKPCPAGATTTLKRAGSGAIGDYVGRLICTITNNLNMAVDLTDGALSAIRVLHSGSIPSTNGVVALEIGIESVNGNWSISTGGGVNVLATGIFD